jgi:predicted dehydrogenase
VLRPQACAESDAPSPEPEIRQKLFQEADALDDELRAFVHAVQRRSEPAVSGPAGRKALEIALNIMEQIDLGPRARFA